ncbi:MAG: hypothetical protein HN494_04110 [Opitutae bacterium]|nr:hypothetical protein [Opitutae bacterium]
MDFNSAQNSYPYALERQASLLAASLRFPEPSSGRWLLRLVRLPAKGRETIIDLEKRNNRCAVTVTRFLKPLRQLWEALDRPSEIPRTTIPLEISMANLDCNDALFRETERGTVLDCINAPIDDSGMDHYLIFFTDTIDCKIAAITDPYKMRKAEAWHRIINRSYGAELIPPRRCFVEETVSVS